MKDPRRNHVRQVYLDQERDEAIAALAKKRGVSVSELVRSLIDRELQADREGAA